MKQSKYDQLGASASKAGLHKALENAGAADSSGLFAQVAPDLAGDPNYYSFIHCDGAGTKAIVSYLSYKDGASAEIFEGLASDALVMNLDDVFCLGLPQRLVFANAIARNARLIPDQAIENIVRGYQKLKNTLLDCGIEISFTGGETADMGDVVRTLVVDAVIAGRIEKAKVIRPETIVTGDVIVGLESTGKASYESFVNSGVGSNGLTLARHCLLNRSYAEKFPEVIDPQNISDASYAGPFKTTDSPAGLGMTIGQALSSPTRTFAPVLKKIYETVPQIHAAIHVTGGGATKVLRFGKTKRYVKDNLLPIPPLFQLIQEHGKVAAREMYEVFNMGQRIELYLPADAAVEAIKISESFGIKAQVIGRVEDASSGKNEVIVDSPLGTFEYSL